MNDRHTLSTIADRGAAETNTWHWGKQPIALQALARIGRGSRLALTLFLLVTMSLGHAGSVREVTITEMLQASELVLEGRVVAAESRKDSRSRIYTVLTIEVLDVIKGGHQGQWLTLAFSGGTLDGMTMHVSDMLVPAVGDHGIYFVESTKQRMVNPLYGWDQGQYLIDSDHTGTTRVMTSNNRPVTAVVGYQTLALTSAPTRLSSGVARGLTIASEKDAKALTTDEFKEALSAHLRHLESAGE